ncbi:MAG: FtsX-like permease family protein [Methylobacteriaceae bacterium]|nr:FtsX-like permease family protein [Methylobacteriaceae bacterium]
MSAATTTVPGAAAPASAPPLRRSWRDRIPSFLRARTPLGWLQLTHNRARLAAALAGVAFADILILMQLGFMGALSETSVLSHRGWNADIVLQSATADHLDEVGTLPRRRLYQALAVEGVASATPVYLAELSWIDPGTDVKTRVRVYGADPESPVFSDLDLARQMAALKIPGAALFDRKARGNYKALVEQVDRGQPADFEALGRRFSIEGLFAQGASFTTDGTLVVSDQTFLRFFPTRAGGTPSMVFIKVEPGQDPKAVVERLSAVLPSSDTRALTRDQVVELELAYQSKQRPIGFVFSFGVVIGVIVGIVIVYQVLTTDVQDHLAEYATLKAMGYPQRFFLGVVFEEALVLAGLGFLPGIIVALVLYQIAAAGTGLPVTMTVGRAAMVLGLTIAMCTASGAIATRRLAKADPADLF